MDISYIKFNEPLSLVIGDTATWKKILDPQFSPAEGFSLIYALRGDAGNIDITATNYDSSTYLINVSANTTATWKAGLYYWQSYVTKGSGSSYERYSIDYGEILIEQNFQAVGSNSKNRVDKRSKYKRILDTIDEVMLGKAEDDLITIQIDGDMFIKGTVNDLMKARNLYASLVKQEENLARAKAGKSSLNIIRTRFNWQ